MYGRLDLRTMYSGAASLLVLLYREAKTYYDS